MEERLREHYFVLLRIALLLILEIYIVLSQSVLTGASVKVLLILALFIGAIAGKELVEGWTRILFFGIAGVLLFILLFTLGTTFILLGIFLYYEVLAYLRSGILWYFIPLGFAFVPSVIGNAVQVMIAVLIGFIYWQHDFVVESYRKQTNEDTITEQTLKHSMSRREHEMQEEVRKSLLMAENHMLDAFSWLARDLIFLPLSIKRGVGVDVKGGTRSIICSIAVGPCIPPGKRIAGLGQSAGIAQNGDGAVGNIWRITVRRHITGGRAVADVGHGIGGGSSQLQLTAVVLLNGVAAVCGGEIV